MIWGAGLVVKFVLLLLLVVSVLSWAIILYKVNLLRKVEKETSLFYDLFWKKRQFSLIASVVKNYRFTPLAKLFSSVHAELGQSVAAREGPVDRRTNIHAEEIDRLGRLLKRTASAEKTSLEKSVTFLATTGNTAPFIGLFGTVWGIMNSFRSIGAMGTASLAVVAPGIAEALVATAMGLFAAIPAVVGYNHIISRIDRLSVEMDNFSTDMLNVIEKQMRKTQAQKHGALEPEPMEN
ncbi:MAG: protein TolQ [Thermodesulfobacteriota bacterium]